MSEFPMTNIYDTLNCVLVVTRRGHFAIVCWHIYEYKRAHA